MGEEVQNLSYKEETFEGDPFNTHKRRTQPTDLASALKYLASPIFVRRLKACDLSWMA